MQKQGHIHLKSGITKKQNKKKKNYRIIIMEENGIYDLKEVLKIFHSK